MGNMKHGDVGFVLTEALKFGKVNFTFRKKDGTIRRAVGTLNLGLIPDLDKRFKRSEEERVERTDQTSFYDMEKGAWRCCKFDSILTINGEDVVDE